MKIIDGSGAVLGRLASMVAKELLKGEEISIVNCNEIIITGNKYNIRASFDEKRRRVGTVQKGPKFPRNIERIVKRTVRGMLPSHRFGRGLDAWKRLKCYNEVPGEMLDKEKIKIETKPKIKFIEMKTLTKK